MERQLTFYRQYKKLIIAVLIVIVLALVLFSGNKAYSYIKGKEKSLKGEITALEKSRDSLFLEVGEREFKIDSVLSIKENNYYSQYRRERRKRITLQNKLKDLEKKEYDREYLDSLAKNIKYAN